MEKHNVIQKVYYCCRSRLGVVKNDIKSGVAVEFPTRLKMWNLGFFGEKYYLYNLRENDSRDYLSDYNQALTRFINCPYDIILNNKVIFEEIMSSYIRVPVNYALISEGKIFPLQSRIKINKIDSMIRVCEEQNGLVFKPVVGSQGKGVAILKVKNDKIFINNKEAHIREVEGFISALDNYIITEYIRQGEYSNSLSPYSTNTMRILIMVDPITNKPFIARAVQRIGGKASGGLDNFSQGGYSANIDLDTGKLTAAVTKWSAKELTWHKVHPDTGEQIEGKRVPKWNEIKNKLLSVMNELPYIKYIGWDVVLTDDELVVIEGNNHPQVGVLQLHKPLLVEPRIRKFYEYHGII